MTEQIARQEEQLPEPTAFEEHSEAANGCLPQPTAQLSSKDLLSTVTRDFFMGQALELTFLELSDDTCTSAVPNLRNVQVLPLPCVKTLVR